MNRHDARLCDTARAKLNLTLEVLGRRADGYHELISLVAFTELGDELELSPGALSLVVEGTFARALDASGSGNLIIDAAEAAMRTVPSLTLGAFRLTKNLPIAAGLGGGSADAASALRLIARANPGMLDAAERAKIAATLGSDVTVCLDSRPAIMSGRGEIVIAVETLPVCGVLLANPGVPLAAKDVYAALEAQPLAESHPQEPPPNFVGTFERLIDYALPHGNDLEAPAVSLAPSIEAVLVALSELPGVRLVRMSGSGATCFALFATDDEARRGASILRASHAQWWIAATKLQKPVPSVP